MAAFTALLSALGGAAKDGLSTALKNPNTWMGGSQPQQQPGQANPMLTPGYRPLPTPGPMLTPPPAAAPAPVQGGPVRTMAPDPILGPMPTPQIKRRPLAPAQVPEERQPMFGGMDQLY